MSSAWMRSLAALVAATVAVAVPYVMPIASDALRLGLYEAVTVAALAFAAAASLRQAWRPGAPRTAWVLVGASCLAWAAGDTVWYVAQLDSAIPFPHASDALYLLSVALAAAGAVALAWRPGGARRATLTIVDGALVALCALLVAWVVVVRDAVAASEGTPLEVAVGLAYPVGDVLVLAALAIAASRLGAQRAVRLWPVLAGFALTAVADLAYALLTLHAGGYVPTAIDLAWPASALLLAWGALRAADAASGPERPANTFEERLPITACLLGLVATTADFLAHRDMDVVVEGIVVAGGALLLLRFHLFADVHARVARRLAHAQSLARLGTWRLEGGQVVLDERSGGLLGLPSGQALAPQVVAQRVAPADQAHVLAAFGGDGGPHVDRTVELAAALGDGAGPRYAHLLAQRGGADGPGLAGSLQDVTEQVRLRQAILAAQQHQQEAARLAEVSRMKTEFINTAAHELNTPLTPIKLSLRTLQAPGTDATATQRSLAILERNVDRLISLLHDVLDGARTQAGRLRLRMAPTDLAAMARAAAEEHQPMALHAGVLVRVEAPGPVPLVADPNRLHEVVMNLLVNAIKFTPSGGVVEVRVVASQGVARLEVSDSGRGIAAQDLGLLFQPFSQVGAPVHGPTHGSGLGLYICRGIVEAHGGSIRAHSDGLGKGSTFTVEVPLARLPGSAPAQAALPGLRAT